MGKEQFNAGSLTSRRKAVLLGCLLLSISFIGQAQQKLRVHFFFQGQQTLYDRTYVNNRGGVGIGLQSSWQTKSIVQPSLELTGEIFGGNKVLYMTPDGKPIDAKLSSLSLYAGPMLQVTQKIYLSLATGPSFINAAAHVGIRSSVGYHFSQTQRVSTKASYTNVFYKDEISKEGFGYLSVALAVRLF